MFVDALRLLSLFVLNHIDIDTDFIAQDKRNFVWNLVCSYSSALSEKTFTNVFYSFVLNLTNCSSVTLLPLEQLL